MNEEITQPPLRPEVPTQEQVWLRPEQVVRYLKLPSLKALYQAVRRGQLPAHHFGRRLLFSRSEVDRQLSAH